MPCEGCGGCREKKQPKWKEDFPVQWERDSYVTRREMVKFVGLGSFFLLAANALLAVLPFWKKTARLQEKPLGLASDLPKGASRLFRYPTEQDPCILVRDPQGKLSAYSQVCTHLSCAVVHRSEDDTLFCPCHNGVFSVTDGRPLAGPPTRQLPRIRIEERGERIFAVGVEV